jgi:hypothetical protein
MPVHCPTVTTTAPYWLIRIHYITLPSNVQ